MSPENEREFQRVALLWEHTGPPDFYQDPESESAWQNLETGIEASGTPILRRFYPRWMVAAVLFVIVGGAILSYLFLTHHASPSYSKVINSGQNIRWDTLEDRSVVTLAPESHLHISNGFLDKERVVKVDGQAYFSVTPVPGKPFIVQAGEIDIVVLGTAFNVRCDSSLVTVAVSNGTVKMQRGTSGILVKEGSTGVYERWNKKFELYADSLNRNVSGYATRMLYFYDMPLSDVKLVLEHTYGIRIKFNSPAIERYRLNTKFEKQPLPYVLDVISASLGIKYRIAGKTVYFFGDGDVYR